MGDYFERIVDLEVSADEAGAPAECMVDWMVSRQWLRRETSGEAMYSLHADEGYLPGSRWSQITENWGSDFVPGPVVVIVGRHDHYDGQGCIEPAAAVCPRCETKTVIIDCPQRCEADTEVWRPFSKAIECWKRSGTGAATCRFCNTPSPVTSWRWEDDFALGALAVEFWGWPPLTEDFRTELAARLGHRVAYQTGKF